MVLPHVALRMIAACSILLGLVFAGGAMAKSAPDAKAPAATAPIAVANATVPATSAPAVQAVAADPCARKVKVIYAGYGEASRASCVTTSSAKAD
jgi:hypothetical protein